jgi:hypothetical protein
MIGLGLSGQETRYSSQPARIEAHPHDGMMEKTCRFYDSGGLCFFVVVRLLLLPDVAGLLLLLA